MPTISRRSAKKRSELREALRPGAGKEVWPQPDEKGWAKIPRTIAVILQVLRANSPKGFGLGNVYLELLARNKDEGIVEIASESEHALLAGFKPNDRGIRSWRERIRVLEQMGFLIALPREAPRIDQVLILHPTQVMKKLFTQNKVTEELFHFFKKILVDSGGLIDEQVATKTE